MKNKKITSLTIGDERIEVLEGRTETHEKCAVAYFAGPEGWGIKMHIRLDELECFLSRVDWQRQFIHFAKQKLGMVQDEAV